MKETKGVPKIRVWGVSIYPSSSEFTVYFCRSSRASLFNSLSLSLSLSSNNSTYYARVNLVFDALVSEWIGMSKSHIHKELSDNSYCCKIYKFAYYETQIF